MSNQMESLDQMAVSMDIVSRMAIFALGKAANKEEIEMFFTVIEATLLDEHPEGHEKDIKAMIPLYKTGCIALISEHMK